NLTGCQDGLIETEIAGKKFILTHGNFDRQANSAYRLPQLLGYVPDYIISGHTHHDFQKDFGDRKSTRLNSSHVSISYAVFCLIKYTPYTTLSTRSLHDALPI